MSSKNGGFDTGLTSVQRREHSDNSERSLSRTISLVRMTSGNSNREGSTFHPSSIQARTTRTLLILSTSFVVLNLPSHVLRLYVFIISLSGTTLTPLQTQKVYAWQELVQFVYYINFASNFFLYTLCSNAFRDVARTCVWSKIVHQAVILKRKLNRYPSEEQAVLDQEMDHLQGAMPNEKMSAMK